MAWAKIRSLDNNKLSLVIHSVDVEECFYAIVRSSIFFKYHSLNNPMNTIQRLRVLAFLHDIGKINSGFQAKAETPRPKLVAGHVAEALLLLEPDLEEIRAALGIPEMLNWGPGFIPLFRAAIAHHGRPVTRERAIKDRRIWQPRGDYDPLKEARAIGAFIRASYPLAFAADDTLTAAPEFQHHFAGLVALADQIGSREDAFPIDRDVTPDLIAQSAAQAERLLRDLRLDTSEVRGRLTSPEPARMFGWHMGARAKPMQLALRDLPLEHRLVVLEAETGSGKTEAALLRFQRLFERGEVDALYFAVPTRAAATALHARVNRAVNSLFGESAVLALPGYLKVGDAEGKALPDWRVLWDDDPDAGTQSSRWAAETPRRYLAALVAVGTVDQAMLAGLKVKWAHFRAAALCRALLVIDEVHASDRYMQSVLEGVLQNHVKGGGHALLMSATLGAAARARLLCGPRATKTPKTPYPALSWRQDGQEHVQELAHDDRSKVVHLRAEMLIAEPEAIAQHVLAAAAGGARVLVLRNTVRQAVAVQRAILTLDPFAPVLRVNGVPAPHHGRFAAEDRRLLDDAVANAVGKAADSGPVIVVGTQTLEQSLDICADFMITDLCPVDVLLQRLGRLHRHAARLKPLGFENARCLVLTPKTLSPNTNLARFGLGSNGQGNGVYPDLLTLEATRRLVIERSVWTIPDDNRALVEAGTDPDTLSALAAELGEVWERARREVDGRDLAKAQQGRSVLIERHRCFNGRQEIFPDDEAILTRLGGDRYLLPLPEGTIGPFGSPVTQIAVPAHLMGGADPSAIVQVSQITDGFRLQVEKTAFHYGRDGLERMPS